MQAITAISLDIAKSVSKFTGVDAEGKVFMPTVEASLRGGIFRCCLSLNYFQKVTTAPPIMMRTPPTKTGASGSDRKTIQFTICQTMNSIAM